MAIWSDGKYVSRDLDFIEEGPVPRQKVKAVLAKLGFVEEHRYFVHPDTEYFVEFPTGPLTVGDERVKKVAIPTAHQNDALQLRNAIRVAPDL